MQRDAGKVQAGQAAARRWVTILTALLGVWFLLPIPGEVPRQVLLPSPPVHTVVSALAVTVSAEVPANCPDVDGGVPAARCVSVGRGPLANASARLYRRVGESYVLAGESRTNASGQTRFEDLPPGAYWLLAEAEGFGRRSRQVVLNDTARAVNVDLSPAVTLRIHVVDEQSKPLTGVTVLINTRDPLPFGGLTDNVGGVVFARLGVGPWEVQAQAPGFETAVSRSVHGDTRITLRRLSGLIVRVEDAHGKGVVDADVVVVGATVYPPRRVATGKDGVAQLKGLGHGYYDLKASKGGLVSATQISIQLKPGESRQITLTLQPGRIVSVQVGEDGSDPLVPVSGADVALVEAGVSPFPVLGRTDSGGRVRLGPIPAGPAVVAVSAEGFISRNAVPVPAESADALVVKLFRGGTVVGIVVDADDRPIPGVGLEVVGQDLDGLPLAESPAAAAFRRGHFAWAMKGPAPLIPVGELGVVAGPVPAIPSAAAMESLNIGFRGQVDPGATGGLSSSVGGWSSDNFGKFRLYPVPPGRIRVSAHHGNFVESASEVVQLGPGGEAEVRIVMHAGGSLEGRVVDAIGLPVAGARVDIAATTGSLSRSVFSATDGTFAFSALPEEVTLTLARPEDSYQMVLRQTVRLKAGETEEVELVLPELRGASLVVVEDSVGRAVDTAQVTVLSLEADVPLRKTLFTDQLGEADFPDVRGLAVSISVQAPGYSPLQVQVGRMPERQVLALELGVLVQGTVEAERGLSFVVGASVVLLSQGQRYYAQTDAAGSFLFRDIPPGPALITVRHESYADVEKDVVIEATGRADRPFEVGAIEVQEPGHVAGVVVDQDGNPVRGAKVAVGLVPSYLPSGALPRGVVRTDERGEFSLTGLLPGTVDLEAHRAGVGRGVTGGVVIASGETTADVRIILEPVEEAELDTAVGGVAVTLGERGEGDSLEVVIVHVAEGSEAERSGFLVGDVVQSVDGATAGAMGDVRARLSGKVGEDVVVTVQGDSGQRTLRTRREQIGR